MKMIRKTCIALVIILFMTGVGYHVVADNDDFSSPPPNKEVNNSLLGLEIDNFQLNSQSYLYFLYGDSYILGKDNVVTVSGKTSAKRTVDFIGIALYLQRWNASTGKWADVLYMGNFSNSYSTTIHAIKKASVPKGYFYRTRSLHWINHGGFYEQAQSFTTSIYLD